MTRTLAATVLSILPCLGVYAQSVETHAEFEVASVKPSPPPDGKGITVGCSGGPGSRDPGMVSCQNMTLTMLVARAYNISYDQLVAPDWMEQEKFDIAARVSAGATQLQLAEMWQRLLADRFKLAVHREPRVVPKYDLLVAKGGPKFREHSEDPPPQDDATRPSGPNKVDRDGFPELTKPGMIGMNGRIRLYQTKMTMEQLAKIFSGQLSRPVTDNTGLTGEYEIRLSWLTESASAPAPPPPGKDGSPPHLPEGAVGPTLTQAIQDQLGLRLEAKRGPVEFLVVDHMEKSPTGN
jgi:uncharacterized protein (TIGR03435 family)